MKTYLVGGAVRDKLLGDVVSEKDWVVVGGTPADLLDMGFRKVGRDFPVFIHPETGEEYALARTERKTGKGYTGFECFAEKTVTLEEDLKRRDLTINAIAMDVSGEIIDPFNGREDLKNKTIRHISDSFCEDPLRVLRLARFAAKLYPKGFKVANETKQLLKTMVYSGELADLTPSRVWQELYKVLHEDRPDIFFVVLKKCGALKVLFKEVSDMFENSSGGINYGQHMLESLRNAVELTRDIHVRFAMICNNFDRIISTSKDQIDITLILSFCEKHLIPNAFKDFAIKFAKEKHLINSSDLQAVQYLDLLDRIDAFRRPEQLTLLLTACSADSLTEKINQQKRYQLWKECLAIAKDVDVQEIIQKGYTKHEISEQIRLQRIAKIHSWMEP